MLISDPVFFYCLPRCVSATWSKRSSQIFVCKEKWNVPLFVLSDAIRMQRAPCNGRLSFTNAVWNEPNLIFPIVIGQMYPVSFLSVVRHAIGLNLSNCRTPFCWGKRTPAVCRLFHMFCQIHSSLTRLMSTADNLMIFLRESQERPSDHGIAIPEHHLAVLSCLEPCWQSVQGRCPVCLVRLHMTADEARLQARHWQRVKRRYLGGITPPHIQAVRSSDSMSRATTNCERETPLSGHDPSICKGKTTLLKLVQFHLLLSRQASTAVMTNLMTSQATC